VKIGDRLSLARRLSPLGRKVAQRPHTQKFRQARLMKNTTQIVTLFALANLYMVRKRLLAMTGVVRPQMA